MSDKIAEIRREVEERAAKFDGWPSCDRAEESTEGVVIYGVPLSEKEIGILRKLLKTAFRLADSLGIEHKEEADAIWEMLERGKK